MNKIFNELLERYPCLECCSEEILSAFNIIENGFIKGGKLLCCGNGGSAADCDHLVGELMKGFLKKRPLSEAEKEELSDSFMAQNLQKGLPAVSLCAHSALMTAFENDVAPSLVFAQQVYAYANPDDFLIAFTTSGNSENIVFALKAAKAKGIKTVAVTGKNESLCSEIADVTIKIPETETFMVQELTLPVYHCLAAMIEDNFFEN